LPSTMIFFAMYLFLCFLVSISVKKWV